MVGNVIAQINEIKGELIKTNPILDMGLGDVVWIGESKIHGEIIQNNANQAIILPMQKIEGLTPGTKIFKSTNEIIHDINFENGYIGNSLQKNLPNIDTTIKKNSSCKPYYAHQRLFITGNPYIDIFFPLKKGDIAIITGDNESGKTTLGFNIAKSAKTDIVIYFASFDRENEVTYIKDQILNELMKPSIFLCNSNRDPIGNKIKTLSYGISICKKYRDMGYNVLLLIDSISNFVLDMCRINQNLRLICGEDFEPILPGTNPLNKIIYESGVVKTLNGACGSITTIICASSDEDELSKNYMESFYNNISCKWYLEKKQTPYSPLKISITKSFSEFILPQQNQDINRQQSSNPISEALKILYEDEKLCQISNKINLSQIQQHTVEKATLLIETLDSLKTKSLQKQLCGLKIVLNFYQPQKEIEKEKIQDIIRKIKDHNIKSMKDALTIYENN